MADRVYFTNWNDWKERKEGIGISLGWILKSLPTMRYSFEASMLMKRDQGTPYDIPNKLSLPKFLIQENYVSSRCFLHCAMHCCRTNSEWYSLNVSNIKLELHLKYRRWAFNYFVNFKHSDEFLNMKCSRSLEKCCELQPWWIEWHGSGAF